MARNRPVKAGKGERGQTLVEFSVVLLAFLMLVFGVIEFARLYESWVVVQHAAREGARYGVTGRADCAASSPSRETCIASPPQTSLANLSPAVSSGSPRSGDCPN